VLMEPRDRPRRGEGRHSGVGARNGSASHSRLSTSPA
jgi:hypothetical protein